MAVSTAATTVGLVFRVSTRRCPSLSSMAWRFIRARSSVAMGGTQDNGGQRFSGSSTWSDRIQGDGGFVLFKQDAPAQVLAAHFRAYFEKSSDTGQSFTDATDYTHLMFTDKSDSREPMAFYPPAAAAPEAAATVFFGTNRVWQNDTFGADSGAWRPLTSSRILSDSTDVVTSISPAADANGPRGRVAGSGSFAFGKEFAVAPPAYWFFQWHRHAVPAVTQRQDRIGVIWRLPRTPI